MRTIGKNTVPCNKCKYRGTASGSYTCDYCIMAHEARGCGIGKECNKFTPKDAPRKVQISLGAREK